MHFVKYFEHTMAFEDIERLKEKVDQDPNSKLFVSLAEEYKKAGMFDEAIDVLTSGLERQPNYLSARVSLGKLFIERGKLLEARDEFEKVITVIPDNLYAHKKLAEIYKNLGEKEKATYELKTVLSLNPSDEWAVSMLTEIEAMESLDVVQETQRKAMERQVQPEPEKATGSYEEPLVEPPVGEQAWSQKQRSDEGLEGGQQPAEMQHEEHIHEEWPQQPAEDSQGEEAGKLPDLWELPSEEEAGLAEIQTEALGLTEEELLSLGEQVPEEEEVITAEEVPAYRITDADEYIRNGNYAGALNIYKDLLAQDPDNSQLIQRVEELRALLKLLGKDKETLVEQLEKLRKGFKKRRDEFYGSA